MLYTLKYAIHVQIHMLNSYFIRCIVTGGRASGESSCNSPLRNFHFKTNHLSKSMTHLIMWSVVHRDKGSLLFSIHSLITSIKPTHSCLPSFLGNRWWAWILLFCIFSILKPFDRNTPHKTSQSGSPKLIVFGVNFFTSWLESFGRVMGTPRIREE